VLEDSSRIARWLIVGRQMTKASSASELQESGVQYFDHAGQTRTRKGKNSVSLRPHHPDSGAARGNALFDSTVEPEVASRFTELASLRPRECEL